MKIRLLEAGPRDGSELQIPDWPHFETWTIDGAIYVQVGWYPGVSHQFMSPRQYDEAQEQPGIRDQAYKGEGPAVMYVRQDQLDKLARRRA